MIKNNKNDKKNYPQDNFQGISRSLIFFFNGIVCFNYYVRTNVESISMI